MNFDSPVTIDQALQEARKILQHLPTPELDAEILLSHALNIPRTALYTWPEKIIPKESLKRFKSFIEKRSEGYPVAYIRGFKPFWTFDVHVNEAVLIPRAETELLVETVLEQLPTQQHLEVLELGTGSGAIAIALALERPIWNITATDLSDKALAVAKENAKNMKVDNIQFVKSDLFSDIKKQDWAAIVSNPPYVEEENPLFKNQLCFEPIQALNGGKEGLDILRKIIQLAPSFLKTNAHLFLEHGYQQGQSIRTLLFERGYSKITTRFDGAGLERVSYAQWKNGIMIE